MSRPRRRKVERNNPVLDKRTRAQRHKKTFYDYDDTDEDAWSDSSDEDEMPQKRKPMVVCRNL